MKAPSSTAQALFAQAFTPGRTPRSDVYRQGVLDHLGNRLDGTQHVCPYLSGSVEHDAYFAGVDEARFILRA